ncbi:hypothetical protein BKA69DRAFT_1040719 [Paraphysoderma sedebokerense]|nr:hypothetical protein BKA69DRAFT_1040719 [Paraphysoderma sedebokerense]
MQVFPFSLAPPHLLLLLTLCTLMANQQTASDLVPSSQLQSLTEQVSRQGSQLQSLAEQVLSLTQQVSRQGSQLQMSVGRQSITPGHLAQQGLQLQNQIAELSGE